jgi:hypothetical protein
MSLPRPPLVSLVAGRTVRSYRSSDDRSARTTRRPRRGCVSGADQPEQHTTAPPTTGKYCSHGPGTREWLMIVGSAHSRAVFARFRAESVIMGGETSLRWRRTPQGQAHHLPAKRPRTMCGATEGPKRGVGREVLLPRSAAAAGRPGRLPYDERGGQHQAGVVDGAPLERGVQERPGSSAELVRRGRSRGRSRGHRQRLHCLHRRTRRGGQCVPHRAEALVPKHVRPAVTRRRGPPWPSRTRRGSCRRRTAASRP